MSGSWVNFDEYEDVLASTDLLAILAPKLRTQPSCWKWMILAAQNGLQGALVCAIQDTSGTNILEKQSAIAALDWYRTREGDMPQGKLAVFGTLLKRYRTKYPSSVTAQQLKSIGQLHWELRNNFAHFIPASWKIEVDGLPEIIQSALDLIEDAMKRDQVMMHLSGNRKRRLERNISLTRNALLPVSDRS
ncbi:hypothetical protein [Bradyrhizobium valentinum]|uniref:Uncharacterized protein n=1 Tax=Bradyrhizobium valentinum TaxID=1518501 RepID=A0A0R3LU78_9BRAD|nr:hypothetical protein [Bradyrhizobium valentinum]KRR11530.1 hypothetical protein CP49_18010 [Bradyrhizobium valentinum]